MQAIQLQVDRETRSVEDIDILLEFVPQQVESIRLFQVELNDSRLIESVKCFEQIVIDELLLVKSALAYC